ncbi:hypothetical protein [Streptomyces sp. NPDC058463]|uniref:hypothetical protein n=1 Tax=Streptomyces sp. NPDC058463 TaxID=3346510 RepID=UPI00365A39B4
MAHPASASVIWNGDASAGTAVFDGVLCDSPGSVTAQDNSDGRGTVFKFNKPLGLLRCEAHGMSVGGSRYTFKNNSTYYLGWDTSTNTPDAGTIFQWNKVRIIEVLLDLGSLPAFLQVKGYLPTLHRVACSGSIPQVFQDSC